MSASESAARSGCISRASAEALAGLLGTPAAPVLAAGELPPMWHCAQLPDIWPQSELAPDGHPLAGVPAPPRLGMRRMFAGGRARHLAPLRIGAHAVRRTGVVSRVEKQGRSGALTFITVRHTIEQDGRTAVVDDQDIVYRPPATGQTVADGGSPSQPQFDDHHIPDTAPGLTVDPVLLFRFSALTFNAHRIHYDRPYALTEGYPDLLVHGPLQVLVMAEYLRGAGVDLTGRTFEYRLQAPAVGPQRLTVQRTTGGRGEHSVVLSGSVSGPVATALVEVP
jgi:3-methylfumaryl-CoA hydratase